MLITTSVYGKQAGSPYTEEAEGTLYHSCEHLKLGVLKAWKDENFEFLKKNLIAHDVFKAKVLKLDTEKAGVNNDFFELDEHSLLATQIATQIGVQLELDVPLKALFNTGTVANVSEVTQAIRVQHEKPAFYVDLTDVEFEETS